MEEFEFLVDEHGFHPPQVAQEDWITRIDYLGTMLGVELELDWREFDLYILIVRLEDGGLPKGYYVSNGWKCRKHLVNVVREQGWSLEGFKINKKSNRDEDDFKQSLKFHKALLLAQVCRILASGDELFV